jgi:Ni/Fe-hydrogenase b-type cytochrome subunit
MKTPPEIKPSQVTVGQIVEAEQKKPPNYRWVLLWQIPLRGLHWLTALSILTLGLTGLYIGRPYFMTAPAPTAGFMMGWMRFIHFTAAGLLVAVGMFRVYIWLYGGNKFERLPALIPHSVKEWRNLARQVKAYALVDLKHRPHYLGHNPLQQLAYTGVYVLATFQVFSGFALYGLHDPGGFFYDWFFWLGPLFGGWQELRFLHHVATWGFAIFIPVHIYFAIRADVVDRDGTMSSIFTGGRYVRADMHYEDD